MNNTNENKKTVVKFASFGALIASLCCFSPLVLFIVGLASASTAASLSENLYTNYKWHFRISALIFMAMAYVIWSKKRLADCSLDKKQREKKRLLNLFFVILIASVMIYIVWTYVVLEFVGYLFGIWNLSDFYKNIIR